MPESLFTARYSRRSDGGMWRVSLYRDGVLIWSGATCTRLGAWIAVRREKANALSGNWNGEVERRV